MIAALTEIANPSIAEIRAMEINPITGKISKIAANVARVRAPGMCKMDAVM